MIIYSIQPQGAAARWDLLTKDEKPLQHLNSYPFGMWAGLESRPNMTIVGAAEIWADILAFLFLESP
jgi:hypothetical protein